MAGIIQSVFSKEQPDLYNLSISKLKLEKGKLKQEHSYKLNNIGIIVQAILILFYLRFYKINILEIVKGSVREK